MFTITHTLHYLIHLLHKPMALFALIFKLIGSGDCSKRADASDVRRGRSSFTYTAASTRYCRKFPGVRFALTSVKRAGLALILEPQRNQHHFETNKMGRGFLWEIPLHTSGQQGSAALALCKQSPSNNGIGKN